MDLAAKLPEMEDAALAVLRENAERLEQTGTSAQKAAAAALMPALDAELEKRRAAKLAAARTKRAATKRARQVCIFWIALLPSGVRDVATPLAHFFGGRHERQTVASSANI
jgi:hypothetical protein